MGCASSGAAAVKGGNGSSARYVSDLQTHKVSLSCFKNLKGRREVSASQANKEREDELRAYAQDVGQQRWAAQSTQQVGRGKGDRYCRVRDDLETRELITR